MAYYQELVSHPMPKHVDEFSSIVRIKLQYIFLTAINQAGREWILLPLVFNSAFFHHCMNPVQIF